MINLTFGETITIARKRKGINAIVLAKQLRISATLLSGLEMGHIQTVEQNLLDRMAKILDLNIDELSAICRIMPPSLGELFRAYPDQMNDLTTVLYKLDRQGLSTLIASAKQLIV